MLTRTKRCDERFDKQRDAYEAALARKDAIIEALMEKLMERYVNRDSTPHPSFPVQERYVDAFTGEYLPADLVPEDDDDSEIPLEEWLQPIKDA